MPFVVQVGDTAAVSACPAVPASGWIGQPSPWPAGHPLLMSRLLQSPSCPLALSSHCKSPIPALFWVCWGGWGAPGLSPFHSLLAVVGQEVRPWAARTIDPLCAAGPPPCHCPKPWPDMSPDAGRPLIKEAFLHSQRDFTSPTLPQGTSSLSASGSPCCSQRWGWPCEHGT